MGNSEALKENVNEAYEAVRELADESFKLEGFKIVLSSLLAGNPTNHGSDGKVAAGGVSDKNDTGMIDSPDWQSAISSRLGLTIEEVASIYHLDDENTLRLIIDPKLLPKKSAALATKHIAALISAGRQAAKFDAGSTHFEIIRSECEEYGVLNKSNFTSYLRKMKPRFIIDGKGQDQSMRVTAPGFDEAAEIAKKYILKDSGK